MDELRLDQGSWTVFIPSLEHTVVDHCLRRGTGDADGATLRFTLPGPVVDQAAPPRLGLWDRMLGRRALPPSPEAPRVLVVGHGGNVELAVPSVDAQGRGLLDPAAVDHLRSLGWRVQADAVCRVVSSASQAAEDVTRVLIEVLRVPHPADLGVDLRP